MVKFSKDQVSRGSKYVKDTRGRSSGRRSGGRSSGGRSSGGSGLRFPVGGGGGRSRRRAGASGGALLIMVLGFIFTQCAGGGNGLNIDNSAFDLPSPGQPVEVDDPFSWSEAAELSTSSGDEQTQLLTALMGDVQDTWDSLFDQAGLAYRPTTLTLFSTSVNTACGSATSAVGPFYCPADEIVYIDTDFFDELAGPRFGAAGDFAQTYVLAHEIGHHVQTVSGLSTQVRESQATNPERKNELGVRQELQADCYAGVWAFHANERADISEGVLLEPGDIEEGLAAAAAVGDDRIQEQAGMQVDPHSWTHGSANARQAWFTKGFDTGNPEECDAFNAELSEIGL